MKVLVTGSAGHLGEALVRTLRGLNHDVIGMDIQPSPFTDEVCSIADPSRVRQCVDGVQSILHTATLHKPHIETHSRQQFVDVNISGTLNLLEAAVAAGVQSFIFTSTTSVFGDAMTPSPDSPAVWVDEELRPVPKNIYGVTKNAAEDLCELFHRQHQLPCLVLRTSRFFPEEDDDPTAQQAYEPDNLKANEFLFRRVDIEDAVQAHLLAIERAPQLGFGKFIITATTPFDASDLPDLQRSAAEVVRRYVPQYEAVYRARNWKMNSRIGRVYVNHRARQELQWRPKYDFASIIERLATGRDLKSPLATLIGSKGYHPR